MGRTGKIVISVANRSAEAGPVGIIAMGEKISCGVATTNGSLNSDVRNAI